MNSIFNWIGTWDWGNVADWFGAIGTLTAVILALWQSIYGFKRDRKSIVKQEYKKCLFGSVFELEKCLENIKTLFKEENHPFYIERKVFLSESDSILKDETELKINIYKIINNFEQEIKLANIDGFLDEKKTNEVLVNIDKVRDLNYFLFESMNDTEQLLLQMDEVRDPEEHHEFLNADEKDKFDETEQHFELMHDAMLDLKHQLKTIF